MTGSGGTTPVTQASDEELVLAVQAGDTDSLGVLAARWQTPLFRFAFRLLRRREDARDVCQETFLRILHRSDRFQAGARFSTWMYQIALNLCRDHMRHRRRWGLVLVEQHDRSPEPATPTGHGASADSPDGALENEERRRAVALALEAIPAEQREVLVLKEFEGLKFREIAEVLGCPESTVKSRMYYGLNALRSALLRQGVRSG
jgi:RNA polymerase sigma-70 factor, ECF subfamily